VMAGWWYGRSKRRWWPALAAALLALWLGLIPQATAAREVLEVFVRQGCPHCAAAEAWLPQLQRAHPELQVRLRHLERDSAALRELREYSRRAGVRAPGVPTFVINGTVLVGFDSPEGAGGCGPPPGCRPRMRFTLQHLVAQIGADRRRAAGAAAPPSCSRLFHQRLDHHPRSWSVS
jgi:glutaredoxin